MTFVLFDLNSGDSKPEITILLLDFEIIFKLLLSNLDDFYLTFFYIEDFNSCALQVSQSLILQFFLLDPTSFMFW